MPQMSMASTMPQLQCGEKACRHASEPEEPYCASDPHATAVAVSRTGMPCQAQLSTRIHCSKGSLCSLWVRKLGPGQTGAASAVSQEGILRGVVEGKDKAQMQQLGASCSLRKLHSPLGWRDLAETCNCTICKAKRTWDSSYRPRYRLKEGIHCRRRALKW